MDTARLRARYSCVRCRMCLPGANAGPIERRNRPPQLQRGRSSVLRLSLRQKQYFNAWKRRHGRWHVHPAWSFPNSEVLRALSSTGIPEWRQSLPLQFVSRPFYRTSVNILITTKALSLRGTATVATIPLGSFRSADRNARSGSQLRSRRTHLHDLPFHRAVSYHGGNGSFVMGVPAVMVDEKGNRIPGKFPTRRSWRIRSGMPKR